MLLPLEMARLIFVEDNSELATILVSTAEDLGYSTFHAPTGQAALYALEAGEFDFGVVDLLLPDMRGTEILKALRDRGIPSLAMSGVYKGERFAREAVTEHGAVAFLEKPFDISRLFETLGEFVQPSAQSPSTAQDFPEDIELDLSVEEEPIEMLDVVYEETITAETPLDEGEGVSFDAARTQDVAPEIDSPPPLSDEPPTPAAAPTIASKQRALPNWMKAGELAQHPLPRLLTQLYQARSNGQLELRRDKAVKRVAMVAGQPASAMSNLASEHFGRLCVQRGFLPEAELTSPDATKPEHLLSSGKLARDVLEALVQEHVRSVLTHAFGWRTGTFRFVSQTMAETFAPAIAPGRFILETVVQVETLVSLREQVSPEARLFPVAEPPFGLHELPLTAGQARLLIAADGTKTVDDLLQLFDLTERETLAALYAFLLLGLVEERKTKPRLERVTFGL
jgi:CheY-like chemotaxis protein